MDKILGTKNLISKAMDEHKEASKTFFFPYWTSGYGVLWLPVLPLDSNHISVSKTTVSAGQLRLFSTVVLNLKSDWIFQTGEYREAKCSALLLHHSYTPEN